MMNQFFKAGVLCLTVMVTATGCQNMKSLLAKRDNGSLDYTQAQKLPPIKLPAAQPTAPFTPLYDVPTVTEAQPLTNDSGKQYQLPAPPKLVR